MAVCEFYFSIGIFGVIGNEYAKHLRASGKGGKAYPRPALFQGEWMLKMPFWVSFPGNFSLLSSALPACFYISWFQHSYRIIKSITNATQSTPAFFR